jgi:hypothetical protein
MYIDLLCYALHGIATALLWSQAFPTQWPNRSPNRKQADRSDGSKRDIDFILYNTDMNIMSIENMAYVTLW